MKKLTIALFTMAMATGCMVNGKPMFGLGSKSVATAGGGGGGSEGGSVASSDEEETDECQGMVRTAPTCAQLAEERVQMFVELIETQMREPGWHRHCEATYNNVLHYKVQPSRKLTIKGETATLEAFNKKYCADRLAVQQQQGRDEEAARKAAREAEEAARMKHLATKLKNDKLARASRRYTEYWVDDTGAANLDKLAAAKIWYSPSADRSRECDNGAPHYTLEKLTFDSNHKLVKERTDHFCGQPPDSAYRQ